MIRPEPPTKQIKNFDFFKNRHVPPNPYKYSRRQATWGLWCLVITTLATLCLHDPRFPVADFRNPKRASWTFMAVLNSAHFRILPVMGLVTTNARSLVVISTGRLSYISNTASTRNNRFQRAPKQLSAR